MFKGKGKAEVELYNLPSTASTKEIVYRLCFLQVSESETATVFLPRFGTPRPFRAAKENATSMILEIIENAKVRFLSIVRSMRNLWLDLGRIAFGFLGILSRFAA